MVHLVPNALTLANLCCGGLAIYWAITDRPAFTMAAFGLCLIFDLLDGMVARLLDAHHRLGAQLDSLADMVSFGMAPAIVLAHYLADLGMSEPWIYLALLFAVFAAVRLARFNLESRGGDFFYGLPSPAAAVFVFGLYAGGSLGDCPMCELFLFGSSYLVLISSLLVGMMMVTDIPHFHFKGFNGRGRRFQAQLIFLLAIPCFLFVLGKAAIASLIVFYILLSLAYFQMNKT